MKKLVRSVLMLSMASIAILSSCSKTDSNDEVTDVKVDITSSPVNPVLINTVVTLNITATGNVDNKLKNISVTRGDGKAVLSKSLSGTSATETILDTIGNADTYTYTVAVNGEKGTAATKTITVTTKQPAGQLDVTQTAIPLFAQLHPSEEKHFIKLLDPFTPIGTSAFAANKSSIDLVYYYGGSQHTLTSPTDQPMQTSIYKAPNFDWTGANSTLLFKTTMTPAEFDAYQQGDSDEALVQLGKSINTWGTSVKSLAGGDVLIYKTSTGKYGLIKIDAATGTSTSDSQIDLKFVAQQ
jgi:hypothetical protein